VSGAVQRGADLPGQGRTLKRAQPVTEGFQVGGFRLPEVLEGLDVGGHSAGLVTGLEQILLGLFPILGVRVVVSKQTGELVEAILEQHLDRLRDAAVDSPPALGENAAVGSFLDQRVLEDVLDLRQPLSVTD
jgi:hypothetical protein